VEVVGVGVAAGGLVEDPGRPEHQLGVRVVAAGVVEEPRLEGVGDEDPLDHGVGVGEEGADQPPVPRRVEAIGRAGAGPVAGEPGLPGDPEAVEGEPTPAADGATGEVRQIEDEIGVPAGAVAAMARVMPAPGPGDVPDPKGHRPREARVDRRRRPPERGEEPRVTVARALPGAGADPARPPIRERLAAHQPSPIRPPQGRGLAGNGGEPTTRQPGDDEQPDDRPGRATRPGPGPHALGDSHTGGE